jgi:hypothetical protein
MYAIMNPSKYIVTKTSAVTITSADSINTVYVDFDADRLSDSVKSSVEMEGHTSSSNSRLPKYFKLPNLGRIEQPSMIVDRHGKVLVWYLPGILIGRLVSLLYLDMSCCLDITY